MNPPPPAPWRRAAVLVLAVLACSGAPCGAAPGADPVVLLHGLGRTRRSMQPLENHLRAEGFEVVNVDYPSRSRPVAELAAGIADRLRREGIGVHGRVRFVTHSLGGILVRWLHANGWDRRIGRVVMLSPPNGGSEVADRLRGLWAVRKLMGPALGQLGTDRGAMPLRLGRVAFELGVITGNRSLNPLFSFWLPGPDDGKVSVEGAKVPGMRDFLVVPASHAFIMTHPEVGRQVVHFLRSGRFERRAGDDRGAEAAPPTTPPSGGAPARRP